MSETNYLLQDQQFQNRSSSKCFYWVVFIACIVLIIFFSPLNIWTPTPTLASTPDNSWVFLMFTQQWPTAYCTYWKDQGHPEDCNLAVNKLQWTVHGIWPTINNTDYPQFCRRIPFNVTAVLPLMDELNEHWPSIANGQETKFLQHEWSKHGTCAIEIPALDTEYKYFALGLEWNKRYNVTEALYHCDIKPEDDKLYPSALINDCITDYFGASSQLSCLKDDNRGVQNIDEIRLCFDKDLNLKNCTDYQLDNLCDEKINYPATVSNNLLQK